MPQLPQRWSPLTMTNHISTCFYNFNILININVINNYLPFLIASRTCTDLEMATNPIQKQQHTVEIIENVKWSLGGLVNGVTVLSDVGYSVYPCTTAVGV